jgi:hypothetical protein
MLYPKGLTKYGKEKYKLLEETLFKLRQLGYTINDEVYQALVKERALLEQR